MLIWIFFCPQIALIEPLLILDFHDSNAWPTCPGIASGTVQQNVQIWDSKLPAEWHLTTTYRLSSISVKMDRETRRAHLSSPSLSDTPLFLTSFKCSLLTLRLGIPLENCGAFPPSVTSQPSLKHLVHHSYTFTTCKIKQAMWPFYKDHDPFKSHLHSTDPWIPRRPLRPW